MLTIDEIKAAVAKVGKKYGIKKAYLFGSYARGEANEESDIDLIIDKGEIHTFKDFFHLHEDLKSALGTNVDLLTDKGITPRFYQLIKNDRILIYGA
ncbi:MAG: nucleotidyltransferase domain-containing protein [Candidatus Saccharibacteria bacterium]|nr:nucleotidyltransferase domain-containing protein [Candidatus Saccharibacteria bacterium]